MPQRLLLLLTILTLSFAALAAPQTIDLKETPLWQAELYETQKNYQQAADMYNITANLVGPVSGQVWLAKAAEMAWFAGNFTQAKETLASSDEALMNEHSLALARLIAARMARSESRSSEVLELLNIPVSNTPPRMQEEIATLREEAQRKGMGAGSAIGITSSEIIETRKHWSELNLMTREEITTALATAKTPLDRGWLELAYIVKHGDTQSPEEMQRNLELWQKNYRNHPASSSVLPPLLATSTAAHDATTDRVRLDISKIGVLLPMTGRLSSISNVILDGIMAARFENPNLEVRVYDSSDNSSSITTLYQNAVSNGAELIIGPMQKNLIDELARQALPIPTIALNYSNNTDLSNSAMMQFALNPEDEAQQAARRMIADGHSQFAVLTPAGEWGNRLARAFVASATAQGASVLATKSYEPEANNHSTEIAELLKPNRETNENELGADALFLVATPTQARILVPLVKFHILNSIPIYATSHAYSGLPDPTNDRDLNGLRYAESPWILGHINTPPIDSLTGSTRSHPRLFALGYDSLTAVPQFRLQPYQLSFAALSGDLALDESFRVHRNLTWAEFYRGKPRVLPPSIGARTSLPLPP